MGQTDYKCNYCYQAKLSRKVRVCQPQKLNPKFSVKLVLSDHSKVSLILSANPVGNDRSLKSIEFQKVHKISGARRWILNNQIFSALDAIVLPDLSSFKVVSIMGSHWSLSTNERPAQGLGCFIYSKSQIFKVMSWQMVCEDVYKNITNKN